MVNTLTKTQRDQIESQKRYHQHKRIAVDIPLSGHGETLKKFIVHRGVWNPAITLSRYWGSYLYYNNHRLFSGKRALDMGTGSGFLGIIMGLYGAKSVVMTDISEPSVKNARDNVRQFHLMKTCRVIRGDLFENIHGKFDFIVFNHPFFCGSVKAGDTITASMVAPPSLLGQFLKDGKKHLANDGIIMMPFFKMAGELNDPLIQSKKFGFAARKTFESSAMWGIQKDEIHITEMMIRN